MIRRLAPLVLLAAALPAQEKVAIRVDAGAVIGPWRPVCRYFGYDEPNYTYMQYGKKLVGELTALAPAPVYFRAHSLLVTGDGQPALKWGSTNAYTEDAAGKPVYDWTIVDRIFDTYLEARGKPLVEIGFMPRGAFHQARAYRHDWPKTELAGGLGVSAEGLRQMGRAGPPVGEALASSATGKPRSRAGGGNSGMSRISSTGRGRRRNTTSCTTTRRTR